METTSGNLTIILEPKWAPKTATQMARLFENHAFDGTSFCSYQPGYILQVGLADNKAAGHGFLPDSLKQRVRRIPLEVDAQYAKEVFHTTGVLSMSRRPKDPLDNSSSFSILLGEAPHLDGKYTIFGKVSDDKESTQTIKQLSIDWPLHPYIIKAQAI